MLLQNYIYVRIFLIFSENGFCRGFDFDQHVRCYHDWKSCFSLVGCVCVLSFFAPPFCLWRLSQIYTEEGRPEEGHSVPGPPTQRFISIHNGGRISPCPRRTSKTVTLPVSSPLAWFARSRKIIPSYLEFKWGAWDLNWVPQSVSPGFAASNSIEYLH